MFGPENGVCNYLALENIYGMLILWIHAFSPSELQGLYVVYLKNYVTRGEGVMGTPGPPLAMPLKLTYCKT